MKKLILGIACLSSLAACSTPQEAVTPYAYDPIIYSSMNCKEITREAQTVQDRMIEIANYQELAFQNDLRAIAVAAYAWIPGPLLLLGLGNHRAEFAHLRGEMNALTDAAHAEKCDQNRGYLDQ